MKNIILVIFLIGNIVCGQDRLSFVKDVTIKKDIQKSIDYLNKSSLIPKEIKDKVIFITLDFHDIYGQEIEGYGINYSTQIPMLFSNLNKNGQFITDSQNNILFYNYSKNIVFVFFTGFRYFDQEKMKQLSSEVKINSENLTKSEFFKYEKGKNDLALGTVENFISLENMDGKFTPVRVKTFDLKTFMEVWYEIDVQEIPVSQTKYKKVSKENSEYKYHTHSNWILLLSSDTSLLNKPQIIDNKIIRKCKG